MMCTVQIDLFMSISSSCSLPYSLFVVQRQAIVKSDDLHQNGIEIELMHINKPGQMFDVDLFFKVM